MATQVVGSILLLVDNSTYLLCEENQTQELNFVLPKNKERTSNWFKPSIHHSTTLNTRIRIATLFKKNIFFLKKHSDIPKTIVYEKTIYQRHRSYHNFQKSNGNIYLTCITPTNIFFLLNFRN